MEPNERLHALDAARVFALLLGIVLHATMSFFLPIPAHDVSQSVALAVTFYVIHLFRMTLFFFLAGFFAHLAFHRRGARGFAADRAKRILVPLAGGWILLAPPTIAAVAWGVSRSLPDGPPAGAEVAAPHGFPLVHLWFLYYLAIFYVAALALRAAFVALDRGGSLRVGVDSALRRAIGLGIAPLALAAPTAAVLFFDADWPVWFGIPTPESGLAPQLPAVAAFGTAFVAGWLVHRQVDLLGTFGRRWRGHLAAAVALTIGCLAIVGPAPALETATSLAGGASMRLAYATAYALAIWCWTFGLLGAALRFFARESATRRYLADASYFIYLAHLPIVFALQALLSTVPLSWLVKFPLVLAATTGALLASYHFLVRPTWVGELLNGRRRSRNRQAVAVPAPTPAGAGVPIAELVAVRKRYGKAIALDGLSLAVRPGELLALLGPNGAGKSTAIGLWLGTLQPDEGEARLLGGSPLDVASRLGVGVMMQEVALAPALTAREHVELVSSSYRAPLAAAEALALSGTEPLAGKRYGKLSAGQKRQVQFATAVCGRPRLLFLDEPTVGLDVQAREAMWRAIRELRDGGCAIVLTTHYLEEAEALADRVAVIARGRLVAEGSVAEMRALVARKRIRCASRLALDDVRRWPGVVEAEREAAVLQLTASDAEGVVRRLLAADPELAGLEVRQASLAEAFTELTREAA